MAKLHVISFVLDITRRCNMKCDHCLRGAAQPADLSLDRLNTILDGIASISTLTFTGGEPSLKPEIIMKTLELAKKKKIQVEQVYIVTNGKHVPDSFIDACFAWHRYTLECSCGYDPKTRLNHDDLAHLIKSMINYPDNLAGCSVALSMDAYHEPIPVANVYKLMALPHFTMDKYNPGYSERWVIRTGRAEKNNLGEERPWLYSDSARDLEIEPVNDDGENLEFSVPDLYVTCNGYVLKDCDYPYKDEKRMSIMQIPEKDARPGNWVDVLIMMQGLNLD